MTIDKESLRPAFEAKFPVPAHCRRCGDGYAASEYNAWEAHEYAQKWKGWCAAFESLGEPVCRAAPALAAWQPIETAPTDGTLVLGWIDGLEIMVYADGRWWNSQGYSSQPTHWMPAPSSPGVKA